MDTQLLIDRLRPELPPFFTRKVASEKTGGLYAPGTLANMDSAGKGPGAISAGKSVVYEREAFLNWLALRMEAVSERR